MTCVHFEDIGDSFDDDFFNTKFLESEQNHFVHLIELV
jgi:hypothetical protein